MRARLRAETRRLHRRVERASPFGRSLTRAAYVEHLARRLGFQRAIEPALARWLAAGPGRSWLGSWDPERSGSALLRADLAHFGWSAAELAALPDCVEAARIPSFAAALGGAYVLAGATLGGHSVAPWVARRLRLDPEGDAGGLAFLRGGTCAAEARRRFTATLDMIEAHAAELDERGRAAIVDGARQTFASLARWLEQGGSCPG